MQIQQTGSKRVFTVDWVAAYRALPLWQLLPPPAREVMLECLEVAVYTRPSELGQEAYESIKNSELVDVSPKGLGARFKKEHWPFFRVLREFEGFYQAWTSSNRFVQFVQTFYSQPQIAMLLEYDYAGGTASEVQRKVTSHKWIDGFLKAKSEAKWEKPFLTRSFYNTNHTEPARFESHAIFSTTQQLVRLLLEKKAPVPLRDLPSLTRMTPEELNKPLGAGLYYFLFYLSVDPVTYEPELFVWPEIVRRVSRPKPRMPGPAEPEGEIFQTPFLLHDLTTVLMECSIEPFRVRVQDFTIYERVKKLLEAKLMPVEDWVFGSERAHPESRVYRTVHLAYTLQYLAADEDEDNPHFTITAKGKAWLAASAKEKLKPLLDAFKAQRNLESYLSPSYEYYNYYQDSYLKKQKEALTAVLLESLSLLEKDAFYSLRDFLEYVSQAKNPLLKMSQKERRELSYYLYLDRGASESVLEERWTVILSGLIFRGLLPLGGIRLCRRADRTLLVSLSEIGRYGLNQSRDFKIAEETPQVVVQPNFEVVFLAPSHQAETFFCAFAERVGQRVGTLFRITQKSVQQAAGMGMDLQEILQTLREISSRDIPQNVEHEINEWYHSLRRATARTAILITCPDDLTAAKVRAKAGKEAELLTDTVVALPGHIDTGKVLQKLREAGVYIDGMPVTASARKKKKKRR